ncbi:50S ribosomal protein L24 [Buchnera aphidicola]|uniref:Large ribosomal subunit protein uL24 n=1 Tax=Buchnera aphidicola (Sarucallis kahawaluokalani) TaxID=1241878 RepID=A0A4D6YDG0_9GAMM|nr:50S ribosomal protein L24 [Buchnera aphidicola]QCI26123.1 50S ribosomal protein L24 [Buchnera aphidicola (Sarucallis kahawaluokalani)]
MTMKIRCLDSVIIISGSNKGKTGTVKSISPDKSKVIVKGINIVKKHQKAIPEKNITAGILKKEAWIHISNIAILNPETNRSDRIGFKFINGKKMRFFKSNNKIISYK